MPAFYNNDDNKYANVTDSLVGGYGKGSAFGYYQYEEGIYVGYRFYETADKAGLFDTTFWKTHSWKNGTQTGGYSSVVQYPFGYGLSYTSFSESIAKSNVPLAVHGEDNSVTVNVTNTGTIPGKQVVELYIEAPYATDTTCGISGVGLQKSAKVLMGFEKTKLLAAGESQQVTITFKTDELASFDTYGHATAASGEFLLEDQSVENERKAYFITAGLNVVAPIMGAAPTSIGAESAVSTDNEGKTGLSSVIASVGLLISMFTWAVFALTATSTNGVGMWIEHSETKLAAYVNDAFIFSDLIMVMVGASMLKGFKAVDYQKADEVIPFLATLITLAFSSNYAMAVAAGVLSDAVIHLIERKWDSFKAPSLVLDSSMLAYLIFALV